MPSGGAAPLWGRAKRSAGPSPRLARMTLLIAASLAASMAVQGPPATAGANDGWAADITAQYTPRLVAAWLRELVAVLGAPEADPAIFAPSLDLLRLCVELQPDDVEVWRLALIGARICAPALEDARALEREAITRIARLDPHDQSAQLLRLTQAIEDLETAEERLAAFRTLLSPESKQVLGPVLSSRLAFEQALLQSRVGDIDAFARSLADAVALDPAFPAATELAAGFFAGRVDDPAAAAELLVAAIVANPTRRATYLDLGAVLMAEGAYRSAARIYKLALPVAEIASMPAANDILCDQALALWGAGDPGAALTLVRNRINLLDEEFRRVLARMEREMPQRDIAQQFAPLTPMMATLYATLAQATKAPDAEKAMARLAVNFKSLSERAAKRGDDGIRELAALALENAWTTLLLGGDVTLVPQMVTAANEAAKVQDEALNRFVGWQRFRTGDLEGAVEALRPLAADDTMARLGLGLALIKLGDERDGARELLAVAQAERGTALGLYTSDRIFELIGARPPAGPAAAALDAAVAQLPQGFDRFIENSTAALNVTIEPTMPSFAPFEPVRFKVTIHNRSPLTLAIDSQGPIDARLACQITMSRIGAPAEVLPAALVPIDRKLQLAPHESVTVTFDASLTLMGSLLTMKPLTGATVVGRAVVNFIPIEPRIRIGFLGRDAESAPIAINGVRIDDAWLETTWAAIRAPDGRPDPTACALMAAYLVGRENVMDRDRMLALTAQWQDLAAAWPHLPPIAQSWLLMVTPLSEANAPWLDAARASQDPLVLISLLLKQVAQPTDPAIDVARRHGDPRLGRLADGLQRTLERRIEDRQRDLGIQPVP